MKEAVFVDTDIILDVLARREPFYQAAARLFSMAERGEVKVCVASLSFANLFYLLRKEFSAPKAVEILKKLKRLVTVMPVDESVIAKALDADFTDFEDAIQYHTALARRLPVIITRNAKDYRTSSITVLSAEEYLARRTG